MKMELNELRLHCEKQKPIEVYFKNKKVGEYFADIVVEDRVIIELKTAED